MVRIGYTLSSEEHAPRDLLLYGRIAEESGFLAFAKDELLSAIDR